MSRATEEWIGKTDDSRAPPHVQLRIFLRYDGRCQCGCNRKIISGESWQLDHANALINGGENRESNMRPLLAEHHKNKTREDVAEKSRTYRKRRAHYGLQKTGRPIPGSKRSGLKKCFDGRVERRT